MTDYSQFILDSFRKVFRALRLNSVKIEKELGVSSAQFFVLQKLRPGEWITINQIAARTSTDQSSVSVVVKKLIEEKLLLKKSNPEDKRSVLVSLSLIGLKFSGSTKSLVQNQLLQGVQSLSVSERTQLAGLLEKLLKGSNLDQEEAALFYEKAKRHVKKL